MYPYAVNYHDYKILFNQNMDKRFIYGLTLSVPSKFKYNLNFI